MRLKMLGIFLPIILAGAVLAATVSTPNQIVSIDYDDLSDATIYILTKGEYMPFVLKIKDVPKGNYTLNIPEEYRDDLLCAPTAFKVTSSGDDLKITCIAKPTNLEIEASLKRVYKNETTTIKYTYKIENEKVWYKVFSGGVENGKYISNGEYIIIPKAKNIFSLVVVKKGGMVMWTGLMFPSQEINVSDDLRIKFFGAYENVSYMEVYSTSNLKFTIQNEEGLKYVYVKPECKVEGDYVVIKNSMATVYYNDGTNKTIDATNSTVKLLKKDINKVICGQVLSFKTETPPQKPPSPQHQESQQEEVKFIQAPKHIYYVGNPVVISATKEFTISCSDGTNIETKAFTRVFDEPVYCTVVLGDKVVTFSVKEKESVSGGTQTTSGTGYLGDNIYTWIAVAGVLILGYYLYKNREEVIEWIRGLRERKTSEESKENVTDYRVQSALEGEH